MKKHREILQRQIFDGMLTSKRLMQPYFMNIMADLQISPAQTMLLSTINDAQPISLKVLAAKMVMTPGAITQLVDALEKQDMITRTRDDKDRRVTYIQLSPHGHKTLETINKHRDELMTRMLETLTDTELEQMAIIQRKTTMQLEIQVRKQSIKKENA